MELEGDAVLRWLLEEANPSVRFFALRDILGRPAGDAELERERHAIMEGGPVPAILALQHAQGWWGGPSADYTPMYRSTVWQVMYLAELGADPSDVRVQRACEHVLHTMQKDLCDFPTQGSYYRKAAPTDMLCLDGMTVWALLRLGYAGDLRLDCSVAFLARALAAGACGCRFNGDSPCAWGLVKTLRALAEIPVGQRTPEIARALEAGAEYLLAGDLAHGGYPTKPNGKVSAHWTRFGFPRSHQSDVLQALGVLTALGYAGDARLRPAVDLVIRKCRRDGRWSLDETPKQMLVALERRGHPSKWITLLASRVLQCVAAAG